MDELKALVGLIEDGINSFLADAKKEVAPKSAWARARKQTITLQRQFKEYRSLSVQVSKGMKKEK